MARAPNLLNVDPTKFYLDKSGRSFDSVRQKREAVPVDMMSRARLDGNYEPVLALIRQQQQKLSENIAKRDVAIGNFNDAKNRADRIEAGNMALVIPKMLTGAGAVTLGANVGSAVLQGGTVQRYADAINPELASGLDTIGNALSKVQSFSNNVSNAVGGLLGAGDGDIGARRQELSNLMYDRYLKDVPIQDRYEVYLKSIKTDLDQSNKAFDDMQIKSREAGDKALANGWTFDAGTGNWYDPQGFASSLQFDSVPSGILSRGLDESQVRSALDPYMLPRLREELLAAQKSSLEQEQQVAQQRIAAESAQVSPNFDLPTQPVALGQRLGATALYSDDLHQQMLVRNKA